MPGSGGFTWIGHVRVVTSANSVWTAKKVARLAITPTKTKTKHGTNVTQVVSREASTAATQGFRAPGSW